MYAIAQRDERGLDRAVEEAKYRMKVRIAPQTWPKKATYKVEVWTDVLFAFCAWCVCSVMA